MREVSIVKVSEDTPLTPMRKSRESKLAQRREKGFLDKQERRFIQLTGLEVTEKEYQEIQRKRFGHRGR
jgi:hypothetical protein